MLVFILAVIWAIYLATVLRSRRERRSMSSIATFNRHLAVLARAGAPAGRAAQHPTSHLAVVRHRPAPPSVRRPPVWLTPMSLDDARDRRRQVLTSLAAAASLTLAGAIVAGPALLLIHLLVDAALVGYVVALIRLRHPNVEQRSTVVYLPPRLPRRLPAAVEPVSYLQRPAN